MAADVQIGERERARPRIGSGDVARGPDDATARRPAPDLDGDATDRGGIAEPARRVAFSTRLALPALLLGGACSSSDSDDRKLLFAADQGAQDGTTTLLRLRPAKTRGVAAHGFGLKGFRNITGLATDWRTGTVYGVDQEVGQLLRLDPVTGEVSVVGAVGFSGISGLAFDPNAGSSSDGEEEGGVLYGVDDDTDQLLTIHTGTGVGTAVGAIGLSQVDGLAVDPATSTLYGYDQVEGLFSIDAVSGAGVQIPGATPVGHISGLAFDPETDTLYGVDRDAAELVVLDPATGQVLSSQPLPGSRIEGLAVDRATGRLLGSDLADASLQSIDPATGSRTLVRNLGFRPVAGLAFDPATGDFLGLNQTDGGSQLIEIDSRTAGGTFRADLVQPIDGIALDTNDGILYGVNLATNQIAVVDPDTGATTDVGPPEGFPQPVGALAFDPVGKRLYLTFEGAGVDTLFSFHPTTSTLAQIGPTGFFDLRGLAVDPDSGALFAIERDAGQLLALDPATGAGTVVGRSGLRSAAALAFDSRNRRLCGIDDDRGHLFRIDVETGAATGVGALGFDEEMGGLDFDRNTKTIYASLDRDESLARIDAETGACTFIGRTVSGVGEGLAFDPDTARLYTVDPERRLLVAVDPVTGVRTEIGRTGVRDLQGLAFDPNTSTLFGTDAATGNLFTFDPNTGQGSAVGPSVAAANLAFDPDTNTLLAVSGAELVEIDPSTGFATPVGSIFPAIGTVAGLAFDPGFGPDGVLYAMNDAGGLFALDPVSALAVPVGSETRDIRGLEFDPDSRTLFGIDRLTDRLVTIDTSTGASQLRASLGFRDIAGLAFDPNSGAPQAVGPTSSAIRGLAFDPDTNTLYGTDGTDLLTLDTRTGASTRLGGLGGTGTAEGLAFDPKERRIYAIFDAPAGEADALLRLDPVTFVGESAPMPTRSSRGLAFRR